MVKPSKEGRDKKQSETAEISLQKVLSVFSDGREHGFMEIVRLSGLSNPTVSRVLKELVAHGEVEKVQPPSRCAELHGLPWTIGAAIPKRTRVKIERKFRKWRSANDGRGVSVLITGDLHESRPKYRRPPPQSARAYFKEAFLKMKE